MSRPLRVRPLRNYMFTPCGKRMFKTRAAAMRRMREIQRDARSVVVPCRTYRCDVCHCWHLTSRPSWQ